MKSIESVDLSRAISKLLRTEHNGKRANTATATTTKTMKVAIARTSYSCAILFTLDTIKL